MSAPKHTPGPWSRSWVYGAIRHINKNVDVDAFWAPAEGEDREAANFPNVRINPADADLLASAPDLLAALETMQPHFCSWGCTRDPVRSTSHTDACTQATAAIAKARGG